MALPRRILSFGTPALFRATRVRPILAVSLALLACSFHRLEAQTYSVSTFVGTAGAAGSTDATGAAARLNGPVGVAVDASGNVYVGDSNNHTIRKVTAAGVTTTLAGQAGSSGSADGTGGAARFNTPQHVAVDGAGNVYVADGSNHIIRKITSGGVVTTLAGLAGAPGTSDGTGSAARFNYPRGIAVDASGNVYVGDHTNHAIRKITAAGVVTTFAGSAGVSGSGDGTGAAARFYLPFGVAVDSGGNVFVGDYGNLTIRKITPAGVVTTLAGSAGQQGATDGTGAAARFFTPLSIAIDGSGNIYVGEYGNNTIRKVTSAGVVTTLAGQAGTSGSTDGVGTAARFNAPHGVAATSSGTVYLADYSNHTIRRATAGAPPTITTQPQVSQNKVNVGTSLTFTIGVSSASAVTYLWERKPVLQGGGWEAVGTSSTLTTTASSMFTASGSYSFLEYRCTATNASGSVVSQSVNVEVGLLGFSQQPANRSVSVGASTTFSITPSFPGGVVYYAWQRLAAGSSTWTTLANGGAYSGATTAILTVSSTTLAMNGDQFRCEIGNPSDFGISAAATLSVTAGTAPVISTQPLSQMVAESPSAVVSFTVVATGTPTPSFQWQVQAPGGAGTWSNLANGGSYSQVTSSVLNVSSPVLELDGTQFRCVVSNVAGTATSNPATLTVIRPAITNPVSQVVQLGTTATFTFSSSGLPPLPPPLFRWSRLPAGSSTWVPISDDATYSGSVNSYTLTISNVTLAMNGDQFRINATNIGSVIYYNLTSAPATLTVVSGAVPVITGNPVSQTVTANPSGVVQMSVVATSSTTPTYQWQIQPAGSGAWTNLSNGGTFSQVATPTLTLTGPLSTMNGDQFRCVVTNSAGSVPSAPATLTVVAPNLLQITAHPVSQSVVENTSGLVQFSVTATGTPTPTYKWQVLLPGPNQNWFDLANNGIYSSVTSSTLYVSSPLVSMSGTQYRCVVTNSGASLPSNPATLTVTASLPGFSRQPGSVSVAVGQSATFSVDVSGSPTPTLQWQVSLDGGATWQNSPGATGGTFTIPSTTLAQNGQRYRAVATNSSGTSVNSSAAVLTVTEQIQPNSVFTQQPANTTVPVGQAATFAVAVSGSPAPSLQWQVSTDGGSTWQNVSGATGLTLTTAATTLAFNGQRFRVVASLSGGTSATSSSAILTVGEQPPTISSQPVGGTYRVGQSLSLTVAVAGSGPYQYRWFKFGSPIAGGSGATLTISSVQESDAGSYYVEVSGAGGTTGSQPAAIVVQAPPRFLLQPVNATVERGLSVSFMVVATGSPVPSLQWYSRAVGAGQFTPLADQGVFSGSTQSVLRLGLADVTLDGLQLQVRATNAGGVTDSAIATLRVAAPTVALKFLTQPQSRTVKSGDSVSFSVTMEGSPQVSYQWRKDGAAIDGATLSSLTRTAVGTADSAGYSVAVRDSSGNIATSNTAALTVVGAVDINFDPKGGTNAAVTSLIALSDSSYLAAGTFTRVAGVPRAGLAKIRADGTLVAEFDPGLGANGTVRALVELAAGKFLIVGQFDRFNNTVVPGVVRLTPQGAVDTSFAPVLPPPPAGDLVPRLDRFSFAAIGVVGGGYLLGGQAGVVALTTAGTMVPSSFYQTNAAVTALVQQYNGGLLVGGDFTSFGGLPRPRLVRLRPDFTLDTTSFDVGTGPNGTVQALLRSPDGWLYVVGTYTSFNGQPRPAGISRIAPSGILDLSYNPKVAPILPTGGASAGIAGEPPRLAAGGFEGRGGGKSAIQPNGSLMTINPVSSGTTTTQSVASIDPSDASVSTAFDVSVNGAISSVAVTDNERVTLAGDFTSISGTQRTNLGVVSDDSASSRIVNLSTRGRVEAGDGVLILGFAIKGPEAMRVLIRGVGPSLRSFGITDPLVRPQLTIYNANQDSIAENRGWRTTSDPEGLAQAMKLVGAFALSSADDAALVLSLAPGSYTAKISGLNEGKGVALGEVYALDQGRSRLINLSVRGTVGAGDDVLIPAFVVAGGSRMLLMRTIGPGLAQFGLSSGLLLKPAMELRRDSTLLETNQGWMSGFDPAAVQARTPGLGAFPLSQQSADAAVLKSLSLGAYTVTAKGADGGTGIALVEIYDANGVERPAPTQ